MQLQPNSIPSSGARTPPQPLVQTPVGGTSGSQSHSRSSSHSSLQSSKTAPTSLGTQTIPVRDNSITEIKSQ